MVPAWLPMARAGEWSWVLLAYLLVNLASAGTQPVHLREGFGEDGQAYHAMAKAMPRDLPPQWVAPYVYRIGAPLFASAVAKSLDWVIVAGFERLNLVFNALSIILLSWLLSRHVPNAFARVVVVVAFMVEPHSPLRLSYVHPISTDAVALFGLLAGLAGVEWFQDRPSPRRAAVLSLLVAVGVAFHEIMLIIGLSVLWCPLWDRSVVRDCPPTWRDRLRALDRTGAWLPIVAGAVSLSALHAWIIPTPSPYSVAGELARWFWEKPLLRMGLAMGLVFGPLLAFPLYSWRSSRRFLREHPAQLAFLALCLGWAWLGVGQTERGLALASPVVYVLIARAIAESGVAPQSAGMAAILAAQALSSRVGLPIGGPIEPPVVLGEVWERLASANVAWALSYQNMWSQFCAPSMSWLYALWYGTSGGGVFLFLRRRHTKPGLGTPGPGAARRLGHSLVGTWHRFRTATLVGAGTVVAMLPVVWLAVGNFYRDHFAKPGIDYLFYNLARFWLVGVLLLAFWVTGARLLRCRETAAETPPQRGRFIDAVFTGAAVWSVAVVILAACHAYYTWVVLPAVAFAVACAIFDLARLRSQSTSDSASFDDHSWGLMGIVLRFSVAVTAAVVLVAIVTWGHFGGDNDVPGNYLPYYDMVLRRHSIAPNDYWVHFFASKGNGLAFLSNALSDINGAALVTFLMLLLGAATLSGLVAGLTSPAPALGLLGACLYLQYYAAQGAYAKPHIIRNTFILYLILSSARALWRGEGAGANRLSRLAVITAVVILSPLAVVLLLPILLLEAGLLGLPRRIAGARRALIEPAWALIVTAGVCTYNFLQTGLPELHAMPAFVGRFANVERLGRWLDPGLAFIDYRLEFVRAALVAGNSASGTARPLFPTPFNLSVPETLLSPATRTLVVGALFTGVLGLLSSGWSRSFGASWSSGRTWGVPGLPALRTMSVVAYLVAILILLGVLQSLFGAGPGSSMGRFTDFANPLGIALAIVVFSSVWGMARSRVARGVLAVPIAASAGMALSLGAASLLALPTRDGVAFLLGQRSYASMNEHYWDTLTASQVARSVPKDARVEVLNFLPGLTVVPGVAYQRPDGAAYLRDYTKVLYGPPDQAAAIYTKANIGYFLFDVAKSSPVVWSGFSALFTPESLRLRMRLVTRVQSASRDLYLLAWRRDGEPDGGEAFQQFLQEWGDKLASDTHRGGYYPSYEAGARQLASRE